MNTARMLVPRDRPGPFEVVVDPEWIDYNGHVTDAAYATIAAAANEAWCADVNLSADYRHATGFALYTKKLTISYHREIPDRELVRVVRRLVHLGNSSLIMATRLMVGELVSAETETVYVLVDGSSNAPVPFDATQRATLEPLVGIEC